MTAPTRSTRDSQLVKVAYAHDEMEAEWEPTTHVTPSLLGVRAERVVV
jgi:hypothetical protein